MCLNFLFGGFTCSGCHADVCPCSVHVWLVVVLRLAESANKRTLRVGVAITRGHCLCVAGTFSPVYCVLRRFRVVGSEGREEEGRREMEHGLEDSELPVLSCKGTGTRAAM